MYPQKNILILTSKTGGGHISLAEALDDLIQAGVAEDEPPALGAKNTYKTTIIDPQPAFFHQHYRLVSRYALWLWAAEFRLLDGSQRALMAHRGFTLLVRRQLCELLDRLQPDLILTTYPFLSYEVMRVQKQRSARVPLVMLFSDANGVHSAWLSEQNAAATLATTRETYKQALSVGFVPEHLHLVGWPVRAQFRHASVGGQEERRALTSSLKLEPERFTVLLQGGGEGSAHMDRAIQNILSTGVQLILAAGSNRALYERYQHDSSLVCLPYTKTIATYMAAADVIMGKAGPNTLFESVMLGKPFIATSYIPGQEYANLPFIERYGLGWVALRPEEQRALLGKLITHPEQLQAKIESVETYRQWNVEANTHIWPLIRSLLES
jgi:UDP-N-acetylglucosamine:LPS N-acetylglucosamine transferase